MKIPLAVGLNMSLLCAYRKGYFRLYISWAHDHIGHISIYTVDQYIHNIQDQWI